MVLEPWVTPSLFYQFLGQEKDSVAMDTLSFCQVLGVSEGNRQLRQHWDTWLTEDHVAQLASLGINALRLPVGDWMWEPYEPFEGCTDGALDKIDELLMWAERYDMKVLIDMHAWKGSANGLDNGGSTVDLRWTSTLQDVAPGEQTFEHWPRRTAEWLGAFDSDNSSYTIDDGNIERSLRILETVARAYGAQRAVFGIEPVNEPWQYTPLKVLKDFYWRGYKRVKAIAPHWHFVMHDSFRFSVDVWGEFMRGCPDVILDTHIYQAWFDPSVRYNYYTNACGQKNLIHEMQQFHPVIVGEWSLATDNCAMWLNGFNDNLPGYPKLPCKFVPCPDPYMGAEQPGAPPSRVKGLQGPFGTGVSGPLYGLCPKSRDWPKNALSGGEGPSDVQNPPLKDARDLYAYVPPTEDDTDTVMATLAAKKLVAFAIEARGNFFWNFRTEFEDQWSYLRAAERNWFLKDTAAINGYIAGACESEDSHCRASPKASDAAVRAAMDYVVGYDEDAMADFDTIQDSDGLRRRADELFEGYWIHNRADTTSDEACYFDGAAYLTESSYKCVSRRVDEKATREGMNYCVGYQPDAVRAFAKLSGDALWRKADQVFDSFWEQHRYAGVTCDFGGGATLVVDKAVLTKDEAAITAAISDYNNVRGNSEVLDERRRAARRKARLPPFVRSYRGLVAWTALVVVVTLVASSTASRRPAPLAALSLYRATYAELRPLAARTDTAE